MATSPPFSRVHVERIIGGARVALAASGLFAIWMDPTEPASFAELTYSLHAIYLAYSIGLALLMWRRDNVGIWPFTTHVTDICVASVFQYLTLGPSSPFFTYFTFALFSGALRWGWRGTIRTAVVVLLSFIVMGAWLSRTLGPADFELSRFIIRVAYLIVVAVILVYLGQHEERLRDDVRRLARWPHPAGHDLNASVRTLLEHSAGIVGATHAMLVWERDDEPWTYTACWPGEVSITRHGPEELQPPVPAVLQDSTFVVPGRLSDKVDVVVGRSGVIEQWTGAPVSLDVAARLGHRGLASAPLAGDSVSGRVFFAGIADAGSDTVPLVEVVARELRVSVKQLYSFQRAREIAIAEDRIRLARDLHDGVLQSLTGVRLELQTLATSDEFHVPPVTRERLKDLERAIGGEQRELRSFIKDMKPVDGDGAGTPLAVRLDDLRRRIELQWRVQVAVRVSLDDTALSAVMHRAVPLMVHEAVVNAIRHGQPTKVDVDVHDDNGTLAIAVEDDGHGFPFKGRKDHVALAAANTGPTSLRERVISLGGRLEIESNDTGSRVELSIPLREARG